MTVVNTHEVTVNGSKHLLKKYFLQVNASGRVSHRPLYAIDSKEGMNRSGLVRYLADLIVFQYPEHADIERRANGIAAYLVEQLESSSDPVELAPRRLKLGAPALGRPGIPTRPLVNA